MIDWQLIRKHKYAIIHGWCEYFYRIIQNYYLREKETGKSQIKSSHVLHNENMYILKRSLAPGPYMWFNVNYESCNELLHLKENLD